MDGVLPLWKNKGMTSHDCVFKVRKLLRTKKVGHTGTLDPEVEGVLPICVGEATKVVPYLTDTTKTYRATVTLGFSTDTEDQTGAVTERQHVESVIEEDVIEDVLQRFHGEVTQQVPLYSAVKVRGKKLYEYARANEPVERPFRQILIHNIRFFATTYDKVEKTQSIEFEVTCSKGTYVRTLCVDIGKQLGYPSHMSHLVRTATGHLSEEDTITLEQIADLQDDGEVVPLLPINKVLVHLDELKVDEPTMQKVMNGQKLPLPNPIPTTAYFTITFEDKIVAIYQIHDNKQEIKPARVFRVKESR
ncbi:tRNA pseudouridine(55) synthase TruB [Gracilibacillus sp. S3-1-1]|uniref:tRNA pseudouridine(55) synthase TruB n=1 Tax=Gracilibacillus pellucidus TaxID=3095368 RepID=A0ACC6M7Z1_9BACI|nr:tRNA pseudouridine(55) synthase TruB [Gracilibacillus sp. S3-1-1]MDX8046983.1 tRNA pseudouridine(55) synthase TruB [Gracilibacillus sp. S3-1-1]